MIGDLVQRASATRHSWSEITVAALVTAVLIFLSVSNGVSLLAQESEAEQSADSTSQSQTVHVTTHGVGRYQSGRWGTLAIEAVNRGNEATSIEAAAWIGGQASDQVGRSVWLPAESRRTSWMPILMPPAAPNAAEPTLHWMGVRKSSEGEVLVTGKNQDRIETRQLIAPAEINVFAVVTDSQESHRSKVDLLGSLMRLAMPQVTLLSISESQLPVIPEALDAVRVLVVIGDTLAQNVAATEAVQDWVHQGGTLWLMLDTMSHENAEAICDGELFVDEIDRVSLTSYSLLADTNAMQRAADDVELELPVQLVRVFSEPDSVLATADGWPAALKAEFGQGRIFASTLGLDGFFVPPGNLLPESIEGRNRKIWVTTAGQDLLSVLGGSGSGSPLQTEAMQRYVTSRIGYQLPNRSAGAVVLIVFCMTLIVVCGIVHRLQKPVLLLPGIGLLSMLAIMAFLQMAALARTSTDSAATIQIVEASGAQDRLQVNGVTAFHSQGSSQPQIQSTAAGMLRFEHAVSSGSPVRSLWSDQHVWNLQNAEFAAGVRRAGFRQTVAIQEPIVVKGTFDEKGFRGRLTGSISDNWSDAIVADQSGFALPVSIDATGEIAHADIPLPPGQFLDAVLLNAEQARRQATYRGMFDASQRSRIYPSRPTLFAWADPLEMQTGRVDSAGQVGAMLASIPIAIDRPERGMRVRIPSTFLPYRSVRNRQLKIGTAPNFSNTRRTWTTNTSTTASTSLLRFEVPRELLPLAVDGAKLTLNISAPLRDVEISSGRPDSLSHVWSKSSPVGTFEIPYSGETACLLDDDGGLNVALKIGTVQLDELDETEAGTQDRNWQVQWIQLEIQGLIQ